MINDQKIGVVIPCYKVQHQILDVISRIDNSVDKIIVVDDACPFSTGDLVIQSCNDPRIIVIKNIQNQGVGGAVIAGYKKALEHQIDIIVKIDGDGQMKPELVANFIRPIANGEADYTKGNRFYSLEKLKGMPASRVIGNAALSLITKFSSGYWNIFDPTNGYTAINSKVVDLLPLEKISRRYFFESDMLFRLNIIRAVVQDIPMQAVYQDEKSNLKIHQIFFPFLFSNCKNFFKRIFYNYYLRDMSIASIELPLGIFFLLFGIAFGAHKWIESTVSQVPATAGSVMLSALPILMGVQLILAFLSSDISSTPNAVIHKKLDDFFK